MTVVRQLDLGSGCNGWDQLCGFASLRANQRWFFSKELSLEARKAFCVTALSFFMDDFFPFMIFCRDDL
jgi:hypothetical protein